MSRGERTGEGGGKHFTVPFASPIEIRFIFNRKPSKDNRAA